MKRLFVGTCLGLLVAVSASGCIIEGSVEGDWCRGGTCYAVGASCDFYNDMDCINRTQAYWCDPRGYVRLVDCVNDTWQNGGCSNVGTAYAACGYNGCPGIADDRCICSDLANICSVGAITCEGGGTGTLTCHP
jgi:hypothetical protein